MEGQMTRVMDQDADRDHEEHRQLECEQEARPARGDVDAADHEVRTEDHKDDDKQGPDRGRHPMSVVVEKDGREAARDDDHRDDGDDVAGY